jgi:steroid delta-isomerase-like uncharacterized protein
VAPPHAALRRGNTGTHRPGVLATRHARHDLCSAVGEEERTMTAEQMHEVAARHVAAEDQRDARGAAATYNRDCFYETPALGTHFTGKDQVEMQYTGLFAAFPDGIVEYEGEAYGKDVLAHWGTFRGTLSGEFLGLAPTGRRVEFPVVALLFFKDGLMAGERVFYDLATLCDQAGLSVEAVRDAARTLTAALSAAQVAVGA